MDQKTAGQLIKLNQNSYSQIAEDFSNTRNYSWPEIDLLIEKHLRPGMKILDLGCGNGRLLKSLKKIEDFSYLGLDNCSALIEKAQENIKTLKHENIKTKFVCQDILNLSQFTNNEFEVIFMMASFHHIPSRELREKLLSDIKRILKPGGFLIMTNWNLWQLGAKKSVWNSFLSSPRRRGSQNSLRLPIGSGMTKKDVITLWQNQFPLYYYAFTLGELKKILRGSGFKIIENYYVKQDKKACWWNGYNILSVGQKI
ncbi:MAG TPA: class I SAM-dependent methyltransferase [bacterium]|nr:class I SAM-dependent methyltransferase [bacterium]HPL95716.1 class I SAM-dependent methyltransferase [bacterium]